MLDITVCIMSYNRPQYLREALLSVLHQTQKPREVVIYDNGSEESVYKAVADLLTKDINFISTDINKGVIWNLERAIASTKTKYMMLFHDDDRLHKSYLENQMSCFYSNDKLVALSSNGIFVDNLGESSGVLLMKKTSESDVIFFQSSGEVAIQYASNSCVPLSPTIYLTEVLKKITLRQDYGKVLDAVMMCDLADIGHVGLNLNPLYDCRAHLGQDSISFPYDLMNRLEDFFLNCKFSDRNQRSKVNTLLLKQHTSRNLKQIYFAIKSFDLIKLAQLFGDDRFRFIWIGPLLANYFFKRVTGLLKKFKLN